MRYRCNLCGKSVTSELPDDSIIRALLVCPECMEARRIVFPDDDDPDPEAIRRRAAEISAEMEIRRRAAEISAEMEKRIRMIAKALPRL